MSGKLKPAPDAPLSQGELLVRDRNSDAVDALIAERDKLNEEVGNLKNVLDDTARDREQYNGWHQQACLENAKLVEERDKLREERDEWQGRWKIGLEIRSQLVERVSVLEAALDAVVYLVEANPKAFCHDIQETSRFEKARAALSRTSEGA